MSRAEAEVEVKNPLGLHLRPARSFAEVAEGYSCDVFVHRDGLQANGKSIISLVTLNAPKGTMLRIVTDGEDAEEGLAALVDLVDRGFGEMP